MICVDTSVWIGHLRDIVSAPVARLRAAFGQEQIIVGDLVLLEVLQGARDEAGADEIETSLRSFGVVTMLDDRRAVRAARHYRTLRRLGTTIRKPNDLIIGTFCLDHGLPLLHEDRDFDHMARHLGLLVG